MDLVDAMADQARGARPPRMQTTPREVHPAYEAAAEARRWDGPLGHLLPKLRKLAWERTRALAGPRPDPAAEKRARAEDRDFGFVVLPSGLMVAMRIRGDLDMRAELRLARPEALTETPADAWDRERAAVLDTLGVTPVDGDTPRQPIGNEWLRNDGPADAGKVAARYLELRAGEIRPGRAHCHSCMLATGELVEVEWYAGGAIEGQACAAHAWGRMRRAVEGGS